MSLRSVRILLLVLVALEIALLVFGPQTRDHLPAVQAALAAKQRPEWWDDAATGVRWAAWINLGLLLALLATCKGWMKAARNSSSIHQPPATSHQPLWFWPLVLLAMFSCLGLRLPLASKSLWWDESWVLMQASHGKWRPDTKHPGEFRFLAHDWKRCAFYYQKPTNHAPMALDQKACISAWRKLSGGPSGEFSNLAARMPALFASMVAVLLLALLLRSWGWPGAGVAAAFVLAIHPWHIRYGVDARAYAYVVPLCIGGMYAVSRIWLSRGTALLPWLAWGLIEFVWLWSFPFSVFEVAALNAVLAIVLLFQNKESRAANLTRLAVTTTAAAMAFLQVFLPNLMQWRHWPKENVSQALSVDLIKSTLSQLVLGVEFAWVPSVETQGLVSSTSGMHATSFACVMIILAFAPIALLITRRRSTNRLPGPHWLLLATPVAGSLLLVMLISLAGSYFYPRFIIATLPCLIALVAMLFAEAIVSTTPLGHPGWMKHTRRSLALAVLVWLAILIAPFWISQDRLLLTRPYAPLRDMAEFVKHFEPPSAAKPLVVCYGHGHEVLPVYLPGVQPALSRADLAKHIAQARDEKRPLLVMQGHTVHNRASIPDGFTLLDDPLVFEEVKAFAGIEPEFYFRVFRLK